jgi:hypothetical protein
MRRRALLAGLAVGLSGCLDAPPETGDEARPTETTATVSGATTGTDPGTTASSATPPESERPEPTATATPRPPVTASERVESPEADWMVPLGFGRDPSVAAGFVVGDPASRPRDVEPHFVVVENAVDRERTVAVIVRDRAASAPALDEALTLPAGALAQVELAAPATYEVTVATAEGPEATVPIPASRFDCNDSATRASVDADSVDDRLVTTTLACGTTTG